MKKRDPRRSLPAARRGARSSPEPVRTATTLGGPELAAYATLFFLVALVFDTRLEVQFTLPKLVVIRLFVPILAVLWVRRLARNAVHPVPPAVLGAAAAFSVWLAISTMFAVHLPTALDGAHGRYNGLWNQALQIVVFLIVASSTFEIAEIERLTKILVAAMVPVSLYAVVQALGWDPIPWPRGRAASTLGNPVTLAATLGLAVPFALVFATLARRSSERLLWGAILLLLELASLVTWSRGPVVANLVASFGLLAAIGWDARSRLNRWAIGAAIVVALPFLVVGVRQIVRARAALVTTMSPVAADRSIQDRLNTYAAATQIVRDHPLVGVGLENFSVVYPRYRSAESEQLTPDVLPTMVHSGYLQAAATTGIPGLLLYLLFIASVLFGLWATYRRETEPRTRWLAAAFVASIAGYLIQDLSGWPDLALSTFFWVVLGLSVATCTRPGIAHTYSNRARGFGYACAGFVSIAAIGLAAKSVGILRVDAALTRAQSLRVDTDWMRIDATIEQGLSQWASDAAHRDKAGVRYWERFSGSGDRAIYDRSVSLLADAHRLEPFNPYFLVHRIGLEASALQKGVVQESSQSVNDAASRVLLMDRNNAAVSAIVARLKFAQGNFNDALPLIERSEALRPKQGLYRALEGDIRHSLRDETGAIRAYRQATALLDTGHPESIAAQHKVILMLVQSGRHDEATSDALRLIAAAPSDAMAFTLLGLNYQAMDNLPAAKQALRSALALNPRDANARQALAEIDARVMK